jgi:hypothetical protein
MTNPVEVPVIRIGNIIIDMITMESKSRASYLSDDEFKILNQRVNTTEKTIEVSLGYFGKIDDSFKIYQCPLTEEDLKGFRRGLFFDQPNRFMMVRIANNGSSQIPQEVLRTITIKSPFNFTSKDIVITKIDYCGRQPWGCVLY